MMFQKFTIMDHTVLLANNVQQRIKRTQPLHAVLKQCT